MNTKSEHPTPPTLDKIDLEKDASPTPGKAEVQHYEALVSDRRTFRAGLSIVLTADMRENRVKPPLSLMSTGNTSSHAMAHWNWIRYPT
jgi:hypothetical protein